MIHARLVSGSLLPAQREGFTLIELSIVLVIVGLLIGGILIGQSLIETAKNQKLIKAAEQFLIASRTFKSKYGKLPGDKPGSQFVISNGSGNGNGILEQGCSGCTEGVHFFTSLSKFGIIPQVLSLGSDERFPSVGASSNTRFAGASSVRNVPEGTEKNTHFIVSHFYACAHGITNVAESNGDFTADISVGLGSSFLFYSADCSKVTASGDDRFPCAVITPQNARSIDIKIDDGMPNTGDFIANESWSRSNWNPQDSNGICSAGGAGLHGGSVGGISYGTLSGKNCIPAWRIKD